jgi:hypothetical protein
MENKMSNEILDILREDATKVREWAVKEANDPLLSCWCAICSYWIFKSLKNRKLNPIFAAVTEEADDCHCFVVCNGYLIDCTATQFGCKDEIVIRKVEEATKKYWNFKKAVKCKTIGDIAKEMEIWPEWQNPFFNNEYEYKGKAA